MQRRRETRSVSRVRKRDVSRVKRRRGMFYIPRANERSERNIAGKNVVFPEHTNEAQAERNIAQRDFVSLHRSVRFTHSRAVESV